MAGKPPTPEELAQAARARLGRALGSFAAEIQRIQSEFVPRQVAQAPGTPGPRRLMALGEPTITAQVSPIPVPGPGASVEQLLLSALQYGLKQRSYDETDDVVAPDPISPTGDSFDAHVIWDAWIVSPTIDALISFKGPPSQNTPVLSAGLSANFQIRASKVYYQAAPGITGTGQLYIRLARYVDTPATG